MKYKLTGLLPYLAIVLFAFVMAYPIFGSGFMTNLDNPIHLATSHAFIENLKETKWISGWSMDAFVGYPLQLFPRYQLGVWIVALLNLILFIPAEIGYKVVLFSSYVFPALMIFFIGKKIFKHTSSALIPSILFLLIRRDVVVTAFSGQWNSLLGLGFLLAFVYLTHRFFYNPNFKSMVKLALLFALIMLSYLFAAIAAMVFFSVYFLVFSVKKRFSIKFLFYGGGLFLIGFSLCAFYLLPILDMPGWASAYSGSALAYSFFALFYKVLGTFLFAVPKNVVTQQLFDAFSGNFIDFLKLAWLYIVASLPQFLIFILGLMGMSYLFRNRKKDDSTTIFLTSTFLFMIISLVLGSGFWFLIPSLKNLPILGNLLAYRFLLYTNIGLLIFVCYALSNMKNGVYPKLRFFHALAVRRNVIFVIVALFFVANINAYLPPKEETLTIGESSLNEDFYSLAYWIKNNVDSKNTRIVYQDIYGNTEDPSIGSSHLPAMLFYYTNVYSVGAWYDSSSYPTDSLALTSSGNLFGKKLDEIGDDFIQNEMRLVNAKYIVSNNNKLKDKLLKSNLFKEEFGNRHFTVFSLKNYNPEWISYEGNLSYEIANFESRVVIFNYTGDSEKEVLIKVSYHPYWHGYIDNKEINISRNKDSLMTLKLPEGSHSVTLSYKPFRLPYFIVTFITLIGCLSVLVFLRD